MILTEIEIVWNETLSHKQFNAKKNKVLELLEVLRDENSMAYLERTNFRTVNAPFPIKN